MTESSGGEPAYGGVLGAFPYAFRASDSRLFRGYALVGGLVAVALTLLFGFALVVLVANTVGAGGSFSFVRAFLLVVGLVVVAPVLAPVLAVARAHRRGGSDRRYDAGLAATGFALLAGLYVGVTVAMPDCFVVDAQRTCPTAGPGPLEPVVSLLYGVPDAVGVVPPLLAVLAMVVVHRLLS